MWPDIINVSNVLLQCEVSNLDLQALQNYQNTNNNWLTQAGQDLKVRCHQVTVFFDHLKNPTVRESIKGLVNGESFLPGGDNFIKNFNEMYMANKGNIQNSLLVALKKAFVCKINGNHNHIYGTTITNFFLSLAGTASKAALELVSANLGHSISMRHIQRLSAMKRPSPFIVHTSDDIIDIAWSHNNIIQSKLGDPR